MATKVTETQDEPWTPVDAIESDGPSPKPDPAKLTDNQVLPLEIAQSWLLWQCEMVAGVIHGGIFCDPNANSKPAWIANWPNNEKKDPLLKQMSKRVMAEGTGLTHTVNHEGLGDLKSCDLIGCPLIAGEQVVGVVVLMISTRSEAQQQAILQLLQWGGMWIDKLIGRQATRLQELGTFSIDLIEAALAQSDTKQMALDTVNRLAESFKCERVSLGTVNGMTTQLLALSNNAKFDSRTQLVRRIEAAMEESADQSSTIVIPECPDRKKVIVRAHTELMKQDGCGASCTVQLQGRSGVVGTLVFERSADTPFTAENISSLESLASIVGHILELRKKDELSFLLKGVAVLRDLLVGLVGPSHFKLKVLSVCSLLLLVLSASIDRVRRLGVGEWIKFVSDIEVPQMAILAWVNEERTDMVFVNRRGIKQNELTVEQFTSMTIKRHAMIIEESNLSLTDRASHCMLQNMNNQLTHPATHDKLTGLINQKEFEYQLSRVIGLAKREKTHHVVAMLYIDQFEDVDCSEERTTAHGLLIEASDVIQNVIPKEAVLSRLSGDEFGLLIEGCSAQEGMQIVQEVCTAVKTFKFEQPDGKLSLTISGGVVNVDEQTISTTSVMRGMNTACFTANSSSRNTVQIYESDDSDLAHRKEIMNFIAQIDRSIEEGRFLLNCQLIQPNAKDSEELPHYEILLTILDGNDEPMPPQDFIVAAETYNRMGGIDRWVITNTFEFIANNFLRLNHLGAFTINISGNSLAEDDFMEFILEQFHKTRLPTSKICFEITEKAVIGNINNVVEFIEKMQVIGVQFSLDDFGTGVSSYSYLRSLPVDYVKIDGIFVTDIKTSASDYAVVKSINEVAHSMGKKTIAEFVEDNEVLDILKEIGVDFAQGFGVGLKIPITELL